MFEKDIEKVFTAKVAKYLAEGYVFNLTTMNGSQGEDGKVDLRKGNEIIRILLDREYEGDFEIYYLLVGRNTNRIRGSRMDIIWNNDLEEIERTDFYVVGEAYYGTKEEAEAAQKKRIERYGHRLRSDDRELPDAYRGIAYKIMKKREGFKSVKKSEIVSVRQIISYRRNCPGCYKKTVVADISRNGSTSSVILYSAGR